MRASTFLPSATRWSSSIWASVGAATRVRSFPALVARVQAAGPNSAVDFGVPAGMIRLNVGLEGIDTL